MFDQPAHPPLGIRAFSPPAPREPTTCLVQLITSPGEAQTFTLFTLTEDDLCNVSAISYEGRLYTGPHRYLHRPDGVAAFYLETTPLRLIERKRLAAVNAELALRNQHLQVRPTAKARVVDEVPPPPPAKPPKAKRNWSPEAREAARVRMLTMLEKRRAAKSA